MTKVVDRYAQATGRTTFICDYSPPRGADPQLLEPAGDLDVDFVSVAYNPGKSTRVNSPIAAHWIKVNTGKDVVFTVATRDMNKVGVQSLLLGAQLLGLENLVVVKGDSFTEKELSLVQDVNDFRPTELLRSVSDMNQGMDYKGLKLRSPTQFCVGASIDLGRGIQNQVTLTHRKVMAGAQFFISQPTFGVNSPREFIARYADQYEEKLATPIFHGVQVMVAEGIDFGNVPRWVTQDLDRGRAGTDIALQELQEFAEAGFRSIYLVPPILRGGRRDYEAALAVLEAFRR